VDAPRLALDADTRNGLFQSMKLEHEARIARKQQKLLTLNARLGAWYQSMESRRPALANAAPADVAAFNEEAAAYTAFRAVPVREAGELAKLQTKRYDSWGTITDDEYREYLDRMERAGKKRKRGADYEEDDDGDDAEG
jgi:hypothetical protein